ncbi:nucleosome assembly protein, putative [Babesia caballi]|uniref:Nucleosome assembly protein, putative n=1 Tax=Babesia caballi TaxID=5871 RepID=A0AAV4LX50_BABCB|nr:nucleosome assembly protein, putative [Babesia caballi]
MMRPNEALRGELLEIQRQEAEAAEQFNSRLKELAAELQAAMEAAADRRLELLTNPAATKEAERAGLSQLERGLMEMSLRDLSHVSEPTEECYPKYGTSAWPRFWLYALLGCRATRSRVSRFDHHLLGYLRDVRCCAVEGEEAEDAFEVEFHFADNPFFCNSLLSRRFFVAACDGDAVATPIEWKDDVEELVKDLSPCNSDNEFHETTGNEVYGSFFDFFQPLRDNVGDLKVALAIRDRVCRDPLKYVLVFESLKRGEDVDETDDEEAHVDNRACLAWKWSREEPPRPQVPVPAPRYHQAALLAQRVAHVLLEVADEAAVLEEGRVREGERGQRAGVGARHRGGGARVGERPAEEGAVAAPAEHELLAGVQRAANAVAVARVPAVRAQHVAALDQGDGVVEHRRHVAVVDDGRDGHAAGAVRGASGVLTLQRVSGSSRS